MIVQTNIGSSVDCEHISKFSAQLIAHQMIKNFVFLMLVGVSGKVLFYHWYYQIIKQDLLQVLHL